jgi:hypothetical protein
LKEKISLLLDNDSSKRSKRWHDVFICSERSCFYLIMIQVQGNPALIKAVIDILENILNGPEPNASASTGTGTGPKPGPDPTTPKKPRKSRAPKPADPSPSSATAEDQEGAEGQGEAEDQGEAEGDS